MDEQTTNQGLLGQLGTVNTSVTIVIDKTSALIIAGIMFAGIVVGVLFNWLLNGKK